MKLNRRQLIAMAAGMAVKPAAPTDFGFTKLTLAPYETAATLHVSDRVIQNWIASEKLIRQLMANTMRRDRQ